MASLQIWLGPGAQRMWSELNLSPVLFPFVLSSLRLTVSTWLIPKVPGFYLPYNYQSWWRGIFCL